MTCSKLWVGVSKVRCGKSLQSQRSGGEIKINFNFLVNICKYVSKMEFNPPSTSLLTLKLGTGK